MTVPADTTLLPAARRASRLLVGAALAGSVLPVGGRPRVQQGIVLGALALGMPHGAADTELLRAAAHGSPRRHAGLVAGYAVLAAGATAVVRRGGPWAERGVLVASAVHFAEGELACWRAAPSRTGVLRAVAAATTTVLLPAAVGLANRLPAQVGAAGTVAAGAAVSGTAPDFEARSSSTGTRVQRVRGTTANGGATPSARTGPVARAAGAARGASLLRRSRPVAALSLLAGAAVTGLAARGDTEAAGDSALLLGLDLLAPPSVAFAGYFGGWHALRHTARVVDALVAAGELERPVSLPRAVSELGRRSAWAAGVGLVGAAALVVRDREQASDAAFAAVLGLTLPHMTTVALTLRDRRTR